MATKRIHSYEELHDAAVDILLGREQGISVPNQWTTLQQVVAEVFARREGAAPDPFPRQLSPQDAELIRDVFWDLFRQGFITLGMNDSNPTWPWFRISHFGRNSLAQERPFRFTDTSSYLKMVRKEVPNLDSITEKYLDEAVSAFYAGCFLASCVMLGVAAEARFLLLLETV